jgi:hypothetical protein
VTALADADGCGFGAVVVGGAAVVSAAAGVGDAAEVAFFFGLLEAIPITKTRTNPATRICAKRGHPRNLRQMALTSTASIQARRAKSTTIEVRIFSNNPTLLPNRRESCGFVQPFATSHKTSTSHGDSSSSSSSINRQ